MSRKSLFDELQEGDELRFDGRKNPFTVQEKTEYFVELEGPGGQDRSLTKNKESGRLIDNKTNKRLIDLL